MPTLRIRRESENAIFTIQDHGAGIRDEDRAHLFTSFHRGENVKHLPGTGLGLVIVQRCVELHSGTIQLESQLDQGTVAVLAGVFISLAGWHVRLTLRNLFFTAIGSGFVSTVSAVGSSLMLPIASARSASSRSIQLG